MPWDFRTRMWYRIGSFLELVHILSNAEILLESHLSKRIHYIASCGSFVAILAYDTKLLMRSVNYSIVVVVQQHATVQVHTAAVDWNIMPPSRVDSNGKKGVYPGLQREVLILLVVQCLPKSIWWLNINDSASIYYSMQRCKTSKH